MKNLLIITTWERHIGGAQTHIDLLVKNIDHLDYKVVLFQSSHVERWITKVLTILLSFLSSYKNISEFHNYQIRPRYLLIRAKVLGLFFNPDLINAEDPLAVLIAKKIFPRIAIVQTIHGPLYEHSRESGGERINILDLVKEQEKKSFRLADRLISVDTGQGDLAVQKGADKNKIRIVNNAVDIDEINNLSIKSGRQIKPYLIIARRLVPKNGVYFGILGYSQSKWVQKTHLVIAGDGNELDNLRYLTEKLGINDRVIFLGSVPHNEMISILAEASISIVPSVPYEGVIEATSLTALKSLALGIPTIASNIGGLREIDGGFHCLHLVPPGDNSAIAEKINYLLGNPEIVKEQSERGKQRVINDFGVKKWIEKIDQIYQEVLV